MPRFSLGQASQTCFVTANARRLGAYAYGALALGLLLYVFAIWVQVYIDTRKTREVAPDPFFESHRHWRLRTALLFLIWSVLGGLTLPFGLGWGVCILAYLWYVYRVLKGMVWFGLRRPLGMAHDKDSRRVHDNA